jgi:hypothetical protein
MVLCPHFRLDSLYTTSEPPWNAACAFCGFLDHEFLRLRKSKNNRNLPSSSNRCPRKSGNRVPNLATSGDEQCPRFRKLVPEKMKSRKTGEYSRVSLPIAHTLHSRAQNPCGKRRPQVQSEAPCSVDAASRGLTFAQAATTVQFAPALFPTVPDGGRRRTSSRSRAHPDPFQK